MLNGDVLTDLDLTAQIAQHVRTRATGTLALVGVEDPSAFGLVRMTPERAVTEFVEKPAAEEIDTNMISAGAYVLERGIVDMIPPDRKVSIEREVWPALIGDGLYGYPCDAYWLDVGTPERYLQATFDIIAGKMSSEVDARLGEHHVCIADSATVGGRVIAPALIEAGCRIGAGAQIGALAVLGDRVEVGPGARIERSVVMSGAEIGADCVLRDCIVAAGARIGPRTQLGAGAVLGAGATIGADCVITDRVGPGEQIPDGALSS
jgi:mannose-1-phosphate guanylyltransferase